MVVLLVVLFVLSILVAGHIGVQIALLIVGAILVVYKVHSWWILKRYLLDEAEESERQTEVDLESRDGKCPDEGYTACATDEMLIVNSDGSASIPAEVVVS